MTKKSHSHSIHKFFITLNDHTASDAVITSHFLFIIILQTSAIPPIKKAPLSLILGVAHKFHFHDISEVFFNLIDLCEWKKWKLKKQRGRSNMWNWKRQLNCFVWFSLINHVRQIWSFDVLDQQIFAYFFIFKSKSDWFFKNNFETGL